MELYGFEIFEPKTSSFSTNHNTLCDDEKVTGKAMSETVERTVERRESPMTRVSTETSLSHNPGTNHIRQRCNNSHVIKNPLHPGIHIVVSEASITNSDSRNDPDSCTDSDNPGEHFVCKLCGEPISINSNHYSLGSYINNEYINESGHDIHCKANNHIQENKDQNFCQQYAQHRPVCLPYLTGKTCLLILFV